MRPHLDDRRMPHIPHLMAHASIIQRQSRHGAAPHLPLITIREDVGPLEDIKTGEIEVRVHLGW